MKTHLKDSETPITEGRSQTAICGTEVKDARFVFMWDELTGVWDVRNIVGCCSRCRKHFLTGKYLYGICSGEELKERQREREAAV